MEDIGNLVHGGEGGRNHDLSVEHIGGGTNHGQSQLFGFAQIGVHLPVTGDQGGTCHCSLLLIVSFEGIDAR
jgi:hypothetical protein